LECIEDDSPRAILSNIKKPEAAIDRQGLMIRWVTLSAEGHTAPKNGEPMLQLNLDRDMRARLQTNNFEGSCAREGEREALPQKTGPDLPQSGVLNDQKPGGREAAAAELRVNYAPHRYWNCQSLALFALLFAVLSGGFATIVYFLEATHAVRRLIYLAVIVAICASIFAFSFIQKPRRVDKI
jgi:hypothetical protein